MSSKNGYFVLGITAGTILLVILAMAVLRSNPALPASGKPAVAASFYPLYFFAQTIAGDRAMVYNLTPAGVEPHDYEPTVQDMVRLETSDVIIVNGGGLEPWLEKKEADFAGLVVPVSEGLLSRDRLDEESRRQTDPHIWLSPPLAATVVERVAGALIQVDPAGGSEYRVRADQLIARLKNLDEQFRSGLARCGQKSFVTAHAAFGYLAAEYNLTQIGIAGLSPESEPGLQELSAVAAFARANKIKHIFFETLTSPKLAQIIAREVGATTLVLNPLEGITADETAAGNDYFTVMENNLAQLRLALACR